MRKFLITLATLAGVFSASYFAFSTPAPLITGTSGCQEASQLLNCLNSAVINLLRGTNPTGGALTAPISVGSFGTITTANAANNATLNTQGGQVVITGMNVAANSSVTNSFNNSLLNASSACLGSFGATNAAGGSVPGLILTPGAGNMSVIVFSGPVATGSANFTINYWCAN